MAQIVWAGGGAGLWGTGPGWLGGVAPAAGDDAAVTGAGIVLQGAGEARSLVVAGEVGLVAAGLRVGGLRLQGTLSIDSDSSVEVGFGSSAAPSMLSVDAGRSLTGSGVVAAIGGVLDNGIVEARGGVLTVLGTVAGAGAMRIGTGATLSLAGVGGAPSTAGVSFLGPFGTLAVQTTTYVDGGGPASGLTEGGVVSGFAQWDAIRYSGEALTGASYVAGTGGLGTLTLLDGATVLGALTLRGDYSGSVFQVAGDGAGGSVVTLAGPAGGSGGVPSVGTAGADVFQLATGGSWAAAGNWVDMAAGGGPAAIAPGPANAVVVAGPTDGTVVALSGVGNAASLQVLGGAELDGAFNTGALVVGGAAAAGSLVLGDGTALTAASATVGSGSIRLDGAASLQMDGTLTLGGGFAAGTGLVAQGTASVQVSGGMSLAAGSANQVVVVGGATLEVGNAGAVQAGHLAVDAGLVLQGQGTLVAAGIDDSGLILASGGTLSLLGGVTGPGSLSIGANATLSLAGSVASTVAVGFAGAHGTLTVGDAAADGGGGLTVTGVVTGFAAGDVIHYAGGMTPVGVSFQAGSGVAGADGTGTLVLSGAGGATIGSLTLSGSYGGSVFRLAHSAGSGWDVTLGAAASPDPLFDSAYYLQHNPDVAAAGVDPYQQYLATGWKEGRDPSALFGTAYYEGHNPDVAAAGVNPLQHFEANGWKEGRNPSAAFDVRHYLQAYPDVAAAGVDPLLHYVENGAAEGRTAFPVTAPAPASSDPLFDAAYYLRQNPDVAAAGVDPLQHYLATGWKEGRNPDALFDSSYYLRQNPDVAAAGVNPMLHFEQDGWREGRVPSLVFSDAKYLAAYPDVAAAGIDPLQHDLAFGQAEGRATFLPGGSVAADPLVDPGFYGAQLGATLVPGGAAGQAQAAWSYDATGWQRGLSPDAYFDTGYYLQHNPDVAAAHVNPLLHYEQNGWKEGRDPSAAFSTSKYLGAYSDVQAAGVDPLLHYVQNGQVEGRQVFPA